MATRVRLLADSRLFIASRCLLPGASQSRRCVSHPEGAFTSGTSTLLSNPRQCWTVLPMAAQSTSSRSSLPRY